MAGLGGKYMERKTIEDFEKSHGYILPESYINFLLLCNNATAVSA